MNIVVSRDALSCVSTFAKALAGRGVSAAQMNSCKIAMLNQLKGFICQMQGRDMTAPVKRRWLFKDGFGGAWLFVFTFYPQQQLAIINSMSKTLLKKPIRFNTLYNDSRKNPKDPHQQETNPFSEIESMFDTQDDNMENESKIARPNVIRITEADLRYIVAESVMKVMKEENSKEKLKVEDYDIVWDNSGIVHYYTSLKKFDDVKHIVMYASKTHTYCVMQRVDNHKYFFTEIVDAPELGENETKFIPVSLSSVPSFLLAHLKSNL